MPRHGGIAFYNRSGKIPGATGRIPGNARLPSNPLTTGGFQTRVPFQKTGSIGGEAGSAIFREFHRHQIRDRRGRFGGGWGFAWIGLENAADVVAEYGVAHTREGDLGRAAEALAQEMEAWAKAHAPWTDRTGNARRGLQARVVWESEKDFTIFLGHGPDIYYGIWLEVRWGGRYAIILPTVYHFAPQVGAKLRTLP